LVDRLKEEKDELADIVTEDQGRKETAQQDYDDAEEARTTFFTEREITDEFDASAIGEAPERPADPNATGGDAGETTGDDPNAPPPTSD